MMGRHRRTPLADLDAAYAAIIERPWRPDRDYRILAALRIPVAPPEIRHMRPLRGEHFCFFAAREPKWKTWICTGNDLAPRAGPPWYADVQEAELVLNIEAWVWYRARDALYRLIRVSRAVKGAIAGDVPLSRTSDNIEARLFHLRTSSSVLPFTSPLYLSPCLTDLPHEPPSCFHPLA